MKWKHLFPAHILERGWDYYQSDAVENLQKSETGYTAEVEGTEIYDVEVELSQNTVQDMWCSCSYAEDGAYCKHMAAVLYALEEDDLLLDTSSVSDDALRRAVSDLSEEDAKKLLLQLGLGDLNTRLKILSFGSGDVPDIQQDTWEVQIAELTRRASDRHGFIDYRHADAYFSGLSAFLDDNIPFLLENELLMDAFQLVCLVCVTAAAQDVDDSDGGLGWLLSDCEDYWEDIISSASENQQEQMFQWFSDVPELKLIDFVQDHLLEMQLRLFHGEHHLRQALVKLDQKISEPDLNRYHLESAVQLRIEIMEELQFPQDEIDAYRRRFRKLPAIWDVEFQRQLQQGNCSQALAMLDERASGSVESPGEQERMGDLYLRVYTQFQMHDEYQKKLLDMVFSCRQHDLARIKKLKAVTPEKAWPELRGKLLQAATVFAVRNALLQEEGMIRELWDSVKNSTSTYQLAPFEAALKKEYAPELLQLYLKLYNRQMASAGSRSAYRDLIKGLKHLRTYPGGADAVHALTMRWRQQYPRRTAMLDELNKAGYKE